MLRHWWWMGNYARTSLRTEGVARNRRLIHRLFAAGSILTIGLLTSRCGEHDPAPSGEFTDVTVHAAINEFINYNGFAGDYYYIETVGSGAGFFDYDGDGWLDLYFGHWYSNAVDGSGAIAPAADELYKGVGDGSFVSVELPDQHNPLTSQSDPGLAGVARASYGLALGDYDGDHDLDLFTNGDDLSWVDVLVCPVHFRHVDKALYTFFNFNKAAIVSDIGHLSEQACIRWITSCKIVPRIIPQLLNAQ